MSPEVTPRGLAPGTRVKALPGDKTHHAGLTHPSEIDTTHCGLLAFSMFAELVGPKLPRI